MRSDSPRARAACGPLGDIFQGQDGTDGTGYVQAAAGDESHQLLQVTHLAPGVAGNRVPVPDVVDPLPHPNRVRRDSDQDQPAAAAEGVGCLGIVAAPTHSKTASQSTSADDLVDLREDGLVRRIQRVVRSHGQRAVPGRGANPQRRSARHRRSGRVGRDGFPSRPGPRFRRTRRLAVRGVDRLAGVDTASASTAACSRATGSGTATRVVASVRTYSAQAPS